MVNFSSNGSDISLPRFYRDKFFQDILRYANTKNKLHLNYNLRKNVINMALLEDWKPPVSGVYFQ
jgi:hypothetical protein